MRSTKSFVIRAFLVLVHSAGAWTVQAADYNFQIIDYPQAQNTHDRGSQHFCRRHH